MRVVSVKKFIDSVNYSRAMDPISDDTISNAVGLTPIQEFYTNTNVLITGSTGFLGKLLLEKLLRSCPGVKAVYLLVRNKKGKEMHTRVEEIFDDVVFQTLKRECPKFKHKIVGVAGDCALPNMGLSDQDMGILIREINVVFHVAATVRFDEKLKTAVPINIRSCQDLLKMAHQMDNLKSFIHVSTAYSNCISDTIDEKFYPTAVGYRELIMMTEKLPEKLLEDITPRLLDKYPNTYAFTKQIAEDVFRQEGPGLPLGIVRPAIVVSTYKEPISGWINNMYGPTGVVAGAGVGLLRTLHCDPQCNANLVPADMCVNSTIAAAWEVALSYREAKKTQKDFSMPIYNYESSNDQPINWQRFMDRTSYHGVPIPPVRAIWHYSFRLVKNYWINLMVQFFLHIIPAFLVDTAMLCMGKTPRMMKIYSKIHKFSTVITYFNTREWIFRSQNVRNLIGRMSDTDREVFFCDLKQLDWEEFFMWYVRGIRVYLLQDPMDTLPEAKIRFRRLYWVKQTLKTVCALLMLRIILWIMSFVYDIFLNY